MTTKEILNSEYYWKDRFVVEETNKLNNKSKWKVTNKKNKSFVFCNSKVEAFIISIIAMERLDFGYVISDYNKDIIYKACILLYKNRYYGHEFYKMAGYRYYNHCWHKAYR